MGIVLVRLKLGRRIRRSGSVLKLHMFYPLFLPHYTCAYVCARVRTLDQVDKRELTFNNKKKSVAGNWAPRGKRGGKEDVGGCDRVWSMRLRRRTVEMGSTVQGGTLRGDSSCRSENTISIVDSTAAVRTALTDEADLAPHRLTGSTSRGPKRHLEARLRTIRLLLKAGPVSDDHSESRPAEPGPLPGSSLSRQPAWRPNLFASLVRTHVSATTWNGPPPFRGACRCGCQA